MNFDKEINSILKNAQINESDSSDYVDEYLFNVISKDPKIYIQGRDEIDDGQEIDSEKIINAIDYISNTYNSSWKSSMKAYSKLSGMDYNDIKEIWETRGDYDKNFPENYGKRFVKRNINKDIEECLRYAGVQLSESKDNSEYIDQLMSDYERAESDYHAADFYDDNYSWRSGRSSARERMEKIEKELKELTGKNYKELLNDLGSKEVDEDKGPQLQIGDTYRKNGRLYKVVKVDRELYKTRNKESVWYSYKLKEINGSYVDFISDIDVDINNKVN